jgi:hypothetical protein
MKKGPPSFSWSVLLFALGLASAVRARAQEGTLPPYLEDRGTGMATSQFGTYVREGELLFYPFFEYYRDKDMEYKPSEFGFGLDQDFRGKYRASEGLVFLAYGISDRVAVELEGSVIDATLEKSPDDRSGMPARFHESGVGDVEGQLRVRWAKESARRPEVFTFFETVFPLQKDKFLIGTRDWEFSLGGGLIKGFSWGTLTFRAAAAYTKEESKFDLGEYALEYLKRISPHWRIYLAVEGEQDEISLIPEVQWHVTDSIFIRFNSAFGLTSKATDWAPEIGVVFAFPGRQSH